MRSRAAGEIFHAARSLNCKIRVGPLVSASDLARFHAARATLYHTLAFLMGAPENERTRGIARGILERTTIPSPAREELQRAIEAKDSPECLVAEGEPCAACGQCLRQDAFRAADLTERDTPVAEAGVLAALAERSARAIRHHDLGDAAKLAELQYRFIEQHAADCLRRLARDLEHRRSERAGHLAKAIELLISSDLSMLDAGHHMR